MPLVLLVDAEETYAPKLAALTTDQPGWSFRSALLHESEQQVEFHVASNPNESAVVSSEQLVGLWKNLKTKERRLLPAVTLNTLLESQGSAATKFNWIVVDCFPALPILRGADRVLSRVDVVAVRVTLNDVDDVGIDSSKREVEEFLAQAGFRCVSCEPERHPSVGTAFFIKDWQSICLQERSAFQVVAAAQQRALDVLKEEKREWAFAEAEFRQQTEATNALAQLSKEQRVELQELHAQLAEAGRERDQHGRRAQQMQAQLEHVIKVRDEHAKRADEAHAQVGQALQERDQHAQRATQTRERLEQALKERDQQAQSALEKQARLEQLLSEYERQAQDASEMQTQLAHLLKQRDQDEQRLSESRAQLAQVLNERDQHAQKVDERQLRLDQALKDRDQHAQRANEKQVQLDRVQGERDQNAQWVNEKQVQLEQLQKERNEHARKANDRQAQLEQVLKERDQHAQRADQKQAELDQANAEFARRQQDNELRQRDLEDQITIVRSRLEERTSREQDLMQELRETKQTAALSVRLQSLREADLQDLQIRYQAALATQERQYQLLSKLSERLTVASTYFHGLSLNGAKPAQIPPAEEEKPSRRSGPKRVEQSTPSGHGTKKGSRG